MGTKCPNCKASGFEVVEEIPAGSKFKLQFVRCFHCKTAISVLEQFNTSQLIFELAKKIGHPFS